MSFWQSFFFFRQPSFSGSGKGERCLQEALNLERPSSKPVQSAQLFLGLMALEMAWSSDPAIMKNLRGLPLNGWHPVPSIFPFPAWRKLVYDHHSELKKQMKASSNLCWVRCVSVGSCFCGCYPKQIQRSNMKMLRIHIWIQLKIIHINSYENCS